MKILVTGAAGFMGSHVAHKLFDNGHQVLGVDNLSGGDLENVNNTKQKFTKLELKDKKEVESYINFFEPEVIFHLAATACEGASQFSPIQMTENNLNAYMNVLTSSIKTKKLKKVIVFSSMAVYGEQVPPFDEELPLAPHDVYAVAKSAMEANTNILSEVHDFNYTIIRPHNVFGENQCLKDKFRNVIAIFMNRIMKDEPLYIYGDGEQKRAFSYIGDSLDCYVKCLDDKVNGEIINIGGKSDITINVLADKVIQAMGAKGWKIDYLPDRPCEVKYAYCSYEKSVKLLKYKEEIGLDKGIELMADWAKSVGPQDWTKERLEIYNNKTPKTWYPDFNDKLGIRGDWI